MSNFLDKTNIKTKPELKRIFFETMGMTRGGELTNTGFKLPRQLGHKLNLFYIFNFVYRFQKVILESIDQLVEKELIDGLVDLINEKKSNGSSGCLTRDQAEQFNKYLLVQTLVLAGTFKDNQNQLYQLINGLTINLQTYDSPKNNLLVFNKKMCDQSYQISDMIFAGIQELFDKFQKKKDENNNTIIHGNNQLFGPTRIKDEYIQIFSSLYKPIDMQSSGKIQEKIDSLKSIQVEDCAYESNSSVFKSTEYTSFRSIINILGDSQIQILDRIDLPVLETQYIVLINPDKSNLGEFKQKLDQSYNLVALDIVHQNPIDRDRYVLVSYKDQYIQINKTNNFKQIGLTDLHMYLQDYKIEMILFEHKSCQSDIDRLNAQYSKKYIKYKLKYLNLKINLQK